MKVLSLFDGISMAKQALNELNIKSKYYASEIDKFAIKASKNKHKDIIHLGNVLGLAIENGWLFFNQDNDPMQNGGSIKADFDLIIGGSPCTNLSSAGNRKGLAGEQSRLFYEYLRLVNEIKPRYFILENVASMKNVERDKITAELFNIPPVMINSSLLTAQNRRRYYWVGKLVNGEYKQVKIPQPENKEVFLKDIIEDNVDEKYDISKKALETYTVRGKVKNLKEAADKAAALAASSHKGFGNDGCTVIASNLNGVICQKPIRVGSFNKGGQADRVYSLDGKSVALSANGGGRGACTGLYLEKSIIRKLTPVECCRLQGVPDDYFTDSNNQPILSDTQIYKTLGNGFTVPVIKHILKYIYK